ncbi:LPXTG cell wall anchor domain-containing protein [Micromonospora sp. NPDC050397]|uniref:LPXTG cell wall anchor domain-containing protein n=1 Tax=Micromonospora sp. NPDC050397 TaxID=3364279 RepID=UPI00384BE1F3
MRAALLTRSTTSPGATPTPPGRNLPRTGAAVATIGLAGVIAVLLGTALMVLTRRRREQAH